MGRSHETTDGTKILVGVPSRCRHKGGAYDFGSSGFSHRGTGRCNFTCRPLS